MVRSNVAVRMRAARWLAEVTLSSWIKVTGTRCPVVFWFMLQGVDPPCNKVRTAALACLVGCCECKTHTNILEKIMVLWNCFGTGYTFVAFVLTRAKVFLVPVFVLFRNAAWCVLCCRIYPLKVTGHWNDTEKICMIRVCNDMCNSRNVVQTRCRCRTRLERNVCTTPRPTVMLSARVFNEKRFLPDVVVFDKNENSQQQFYSLVRSYACTVQNCGCDGFWLSCLNFRSLSWWLYVWAVCCRLCFPASM